MVSESRRKVIRFFYPLIRIGYLFIVNQKTIDFVLLASPQNHSTKSLITSRQ